MSTNTNKITVPQSGLRVIENLEKPQNGLKGLKYWKQDLLAGLVVSFVATPVSVGIAIASGAPPIAGLISAVVAGMVLPLIGGSYVTISGPAAGLAPVVYGAILALSHNGDLSTGFYLVLPVIFMVGLIQMIMSQLKVGGYSKLFPIPVIEGMMASIGLMIIFKQIPMLIGHKFQAHEFWGIVAEVPHELFQIKPKVFILGLISLGLVIALYCLKKRFKLLQTFPPQLITVVIGTILGQFLFLDKKFLINIPDNPLQNAMHPENFMALFSQVGILSIVPLVIITLTLIDGIESLATITAVDKIDPHHRKSDPDKTLLAMGACNVVFSLVGGLTIIPEILRSSTNILVGGKTQWANFFCAGFVLLYLILFKDAIGAIPLTVLSAIVIFTGYTLCRPSLWKRTFQVGWEQFFIFAWTIFITVTFDLMWGILSGLMVAILINTGLTIHALNKNKCCSKSITTCLVDMFRNPVREIRMTERSWEIDINKPLVSTNVFHLIKSLSMVPAGIRLINLHLSNEVLLVDHTAADHLLDHIERHNVTSKSKIELVGIEKLKPFNGSKKSTRLLDIERDQMSVAG